MKKRILSLLLVLALLVTASVFAVEATEVPDETEAPAETVPFVEDADGDGKPDAEVSYYCEACNGEVKVWTRLDPGTMTRSNVTYKNFKSISKNGGHFYIPSVDQDGNPLETDGYTVIGAGTRCLYFNGTVTHKGTNTSNGDMFRFYTENTSATTCQLNVMGTGGVITENAKMPIFRSTTNTSGKNGNGGLNKLVIYSGTYDASGVTYAGGGCAINGGGLNYSRLEIHGGEIIGGTATSTSYGGGAVRMNTGKMLMTGGTIRGGSSAYGGGTLALGGSNGEFTMTGGEIIGGTTTGTKLGGGAVLLNGGVMNMYKGAKITGGESKKYTGGAVCLVDGAKLNMYGGTIIGGKALGDSWEVGSAVAVHTTASATASSQFNMYGGTIKSDENTQSALVYLYTVSGASYTSQATMDDTVELPEGAPEGAEKDETAVIENDATYRSVQFTRGEFTLKSGTINGGASYGGNGGTIQVNGVFNMDGGIINGTAAGDNGGAVYVLAGEFNMTNGTINGGSADNGGAIAMENGVFTQSGGTVNGGQVTGNGAAIFLDVVEKESSKTDKTTQLVTELTHSSTFGTYIMTGGTINGGTEENPGSAAGGVIAVRGISFYKRELQDGAIVTVDEQLSARAVFTMDGEEAVINAANATIGKAGAIYNFGGTVEQKNGTINGTALVDASGGAVYLTSNSSKDTNASDEEKTLTTKGYYTMDGGLIQGGSVTCTSGSYSGGNVYVTGTSEFTMNGGKITGGKIKGCKYTNDEGKSVNGNAYGGNVAVGSSDAKFILNDGVIELGSGNGTATQNRGGNIGVTSGTVTINGGEIKGGHKVWIGANIAANGSSSTINMTGGTISGGGSSVTHGSVAHISSSKFNMSGGEIIGVSADYKNTSAGAVLCEGTFKMTGGTIRDGHATEGGNIYVGGSGKFTMEGGVIKNGVASKDGGNIAIGEGKNSSANPGTVTLKKGQILTGTASQFGGNISVKGAESKRSTLTITEENEGDLLIAAGVNKRSSSGYGGNLFINDRADVTINGGLMTTEYDDGTNQHVGQATNGLNIGVYATNSTLQLLGGKILGKLGTSDESISIGSEAAVEITLGNAVLHDEESAGTDLYFTGVKGNEEGAEAIGTLTVTDAFTGKLTLGIGSKAVAIVDDAVNTDIAVANGYTGNQIVLKHKSDEYPVIGDGAKLNIAPAAIMNGNEYASVLESAQAAVDAVADGQYVKLFRSGAELTLAKATTVDFNGQAATVNGAEYLTAMDAATNDYDATDAAKVTLNGAVNVNNVVDLTINGVSGQRKYVALQNTDGTYSFHRYYISMRNVGLRVTEDKNTPDLIFSATFRGTEAVAAAVTSFGIDMKGEGAESAVTVDYMTNGVAFEAGKTIYGKNINLLYADDASVTSYGDKNVTATAFIKLGDIRLEASEPTTTSLQAQVEHFAADYANQTEAGKAIIDTMLNNNEALFNTLGWEVTKQEAAA